MKRFLKIFVPILLALCIIAGTVWYLFSYDKGLTQDILLSGARFFQNQGNLSAASWFYDRAYEQGINQDAITIEKAEQFIRVGNFTQAEVTLTNAIRQGGGSQVYTTLCDVFVRQDKLLDAVKLLDTITNPAIKDEIDKLRPALPTASHAADTTYNELITVSLQSQDTLYVSTNGEYPSTKTDKYIGSIDLQKGLTKVQAIAVGDNGLVSPLAVYSFTIVGVIEEVDIGDAAMEQEIRFRLGLPGGQAILTSDLWQITEFTVPAEAEDYRALSDMIYLDSLTVEDGVSGQLVNLKNVKSLKTLFVKNTVLTEEDKAVIGSLHSLETLTLDGCGLATANPLADLISLQYLNLNNNAVGNLSAMGNMPELQELHLQRNALRDLSPLSACQKLIKLDISYNSVTTASVLRSLTELTHLDISFNQISDISSVSACTGLKELRASNNQISDLTALKAAGALTYLDVSGNALTDISALGSLNSITYLNFSYNKVTELPTFSKSCALITIDGSYNELSSLTSLSGLLRLNNVLMDYNEKITSVAELAQCPVLIQVNVYGTKVKDVSMLTEQSIVVNYNPTEGL